MTRTGFLGAQCPLNRSQVQSLLSSLQRRSYTHFCACGKAVDARLEALGGARFAPRADINREDWKAVDAWIEAAVASLLQLPLKTFAQSSGVSIGQCMRPMLCLLHDAPY